MAGIGVGFAEAGKEVGKMADAAKNFDPDKMMKGEKFDGGNKSFDPDKMLKGSSDKLNIYNNDLKELKEQEIVEKKGGSYSELKETGHGWSHIPKEEVHHMPSAESSHLEYGDGPAIAMDYEDHRQTASCGNTREAREYRQFQKELIDSGKFEEAMQMDIDDIHEKFGNKYDEAISQMKEYVQKLKEAGNV